MKKVLSLVLSLVMLLSLVVPVSAEDTYPGSGNLTDKTAAFTIEADDTTLYDNGGEQIVKFHIYAESVDNVPIRAFQFTLVPSANLTLADKTMAEDETFYYACQSRLSTNGNPDGMYSQIAYTPSSRYFGAAGTDEGKGITTKTEVMTIMGKVNGVDDYTLSMTGVVAGNGDAPDKVTQRFTSTVAGATVTVKPGSARPQPNLSLTLSKSNVKVGDTFTATLTNKDMTVSSFIAQLEFDKGMLAVTKIEQLDGFAKLAAGATIGPVLSTPDEANDRSLVGVGFVRGSDKTHEAGEFLRVTFQAKAAGNTAISLHEDSDGADGYRGDAESGTVTVEAAAVTGVTVSGTVKSYGGETENVTVTLTPENGTPMTTVVTGNSAAYKFENVSAGTYTLKVEKANHVAREYKVTVSGDAVQQDAKVCLKGDLTGDGKVNTADVGRLYAHVRGTRLLTDDYALSCGNVAGTDATINTADVGRLYAHVKGTRVLW